MSASRTSRSVIPGFGLSLGFTLTYLSLIVLIPLSAAFIKTAGMSWADFVGAVASPRVLASYRLSFGASFAAAEDYGFAAFGRGDADGSGSVAAFVGLGRFLFKGTQSGRELQQMMCASVVSQEIATQTSGRRQRIGQVFQSGDQCRKVGGRDHDGSCRRQGFADAAPVRRNCRQVAGHGFKQNERRSINLGYAPLRYRLSAFVISAAGTGLAGALWANYALYASPDMAGWTKSGEFMAMIVLGGMGTIFGPILGAAVYLGLEQVLTAGDLLRRRARRAQHDPQGHRPPRLRPHCFFSFASFSRSAFTATSLGTASSRSEPTQLCVTAT